MSVITTVDAQFGTGKPGLAGVTFKLYQDDYVTQVGATVSGGAVKNLGGGGYGCDLTLPDGFALGYVKAEANDASGDVVAFSINLVDLGATISGGGTLHNALITVQTAPGSPVANATVIIRSGATTVRWGQTNGSGLATIALPAGNYTVLVDAGPAYTQITNGALVMGGSADVSVTFTLVAQAVTPPVATGLCTITVHFTRNLRAINGARVSARLIGHNVAANDLLLSLQQDKARTGDPAHSWANGYAELQLVQQGSIIKGDPTYEIILLEEDGKTEAIKIRVKIPNVSTIDLENLIPLSS